VLRQAEYRKAGPSSLRSRHNVAVAVSASQSAIQATAAAPVSQSQTAASLLRRDFAGSGSVRTPNPAAEKHGTAVDLVRSVYVPGQGQGQPHAQAWTTGNISIDHLLSPPPFVPLPAPKSTSTTTNPINGGGGGGGGVRPGMVLGLAAPPGTGKTSMIIRVALSARLSSSATTPPEVLLVRPFIQLFPHTPRY
jgi:hypothetical protein